MTEKLFKLKENHTDVKTEIMAGVTTFMTMAYILAINPSILSRTGMDPTAVLLATCIASVIGTVCMGLMANLPFVLSAGMGLNAYMAYTVVAGYGYPWQVALLAVFIEGIVFIVLSLTNVREAIFNAIPVVLKKAVSVGIGLYIAFIGLQNAGLCVDSSATLVTITGFRKNFTTSGICALLTIVGLFITIILYIKKVRGSILMGIVATWVIGMICQLVAVSVITLSKTSFVPAVSACILPILMGTKSPVYVISVAVMTAFILIFQKALEYFGLHEKYEYRPIEPSSELLKLRAKQVITVLVICILPAHFHEIFFIAPPLIVAFFELSGKGSKLMKRKYTAIALMAVAAFAGVMARFFISEKLGLTLTFGAVLSSAVVFVLCRKTKLYFPPCCAISTLPFIIPKTAIIKFPFEVTAGYIVLTIAAVIITKIDNNSN